MPNQHQIVGDQRGEPTSAALPRPRAIRFRAKRVRMDPMNDGDISVGVRGIVDNPVCRMLIERASVSVSDRKRTGTISAPARGTSSDA
jgi:hypothetical protein